MCIWANESHFLHNPSLHGLPIPHALISPSAHPPISLSPDLPIPWSPHNMIYPSPKPHPPIPRSPYPLISPSTDLPILWSSHSPIPQSPYSLISPSTHSPISPSHDIPIPWSPISSSPQPPIPWTPHPMIPRSHHPHISPPPNPTIPWFPDPIFPIPLVSHPLIFPSTTDPPSSYHPTPPPPISTPLFPPALMLLANSPWQHHTRCWSHLRAFLKLSNPCMLLNAAEVLALFRLTVRLYFLSSLSACIQNTEGLFNVNILLFVLGGVLKSCELAGGSAEDVWGETCLAFSGAEHQVLLIRSGGPSELFTSKVTSDFRGLF